ncbi:unnamed protein product [Ixodes hexagonus]
MRQLLGEQASDATNRILRELFLQRLPQGIRMTLAPATDLPLDRLAEMADRVAEYAAPGLSNVTDSSHQYSDMRALEARIDALATAVAALNTTRNDSRRHRSSSSSRRRSPSRRRAGVPCWYHRKFGSDARKCQQPRDWQENAPARH